MFLTRPFYIMNKIFVTLIISKLILLSALICLATSETTAGPANRLYVAEGASGDGSGWDNALGDLSNALNIALTNTVINEIWVKAGTYKPSGQPYNLNLGSARHNAFYLINGVSLLGGFAGNETTFDQRNPGLNQTILSGDIGLPGNADNSYHTVVSVGNTTTALIGGFIIRDGNADGTGIAGNILSAVVDASSGGGLAQYSSSASIHSCVFTANSAGQGGAIFLFGSGTTPRITQCVITNNTGTNSGGGIYNGQNSGAFIRLCTITHNTSVGQGAGIFNVLAAPWMTDLIIWANSGQSPTGIADLSANATVSASVVQGGYAGENILNSDPLFVDPTNPRGADNLWMTADDGLRPLACSPVINKAMDIDFKPAKDITGQLRVYDGAMDMGAYELQSLRDGTSLAQDGDEAFMTLGDRYGSGNTISFVVEGCRIIAQLKPPPVPRQEYPGMKAIAHVTGNAFTADGMYFVQRYYDILPGLNAEEATATATLFFAQSEFDAFNAVAGNLKLPSSPTDAIGKANLIVIQDTRSPRLDPNGPDMDVAKVIDPDDNKIVWNAGLNRWEVTFDVKGFGGFFVTNTAAYPLKLVSFTAKEVENATLLEWQTAEEVNTSHFEIHRSADARNWHMLPAQPGAFGSGAHRYTTIDHEPISGSNYYRLKMIDLDGSFAFSQIVSTDHKNAFVIQAFPNPATTWMELELKGTDIISGKAELVNSMGTVVWKGRITGRRTTLDVSNIPKGVYLLRVLSGVGRITQKVVVQ
jgi:hypothetical protein